MLREQVISQWTGLKEKINSLKLSEKDQQTVDYLEVYPILGLIVGNCSKSGAISWLRKESSRGSGKSNFTCSRKWGGI